MTKPAPARAATIEQAVPRAPANATAPAPRADADQVYHLTLSSDPLEAMVEWGGNVIGQTPMLIDLLPGPQTFLLARDGYFKATVILNITDAMAGKSESRTVLMIPRKGRGAAGRTGNALKSAIANAVAAPAADAPPAAASPAPAPPGGEVVPAPASKSNPAATTPNADTPGAPAAAGAAPASTLPAVLPFGPEMTRPALISGGELLYPREAIVAGVSGTIIAKCTITAEGALRNCRIIKGLPFLDRAALDVLATRRYSPVTYQGKAVSVEYVFNFKVAPPR